MGGLASVHSQSFPCVFSNKIPQQQIVYPFLSLLNVGACERWPSEKREDLQPWKATICTKDTGRIPASVPLGQREGMVERRQATSPSFVQNTAGDASYPGETRVAGGMMGQ
jgi:hypothetical protein